MPVAVTACSFHTVCKISANIKDADPTEKYAVIGRLQLTPAAALCQQRDLVARADSPLYQHGAVDAGLAIMRLRDLS